MSDERTAEKMLEDMGPVVDRELPAIVATAKAGNLPEAVERLLSLEKQTRNVIHNLPVGLIVIGCRCALHEPLTGAACQLFL